MKQYRIKQTTDHKYIGKVFTLNEIEHTIDILGINEGDVISKYRNIWKNGNTVRVTNFNYTVVGILIK